MAGDQDAKLRRRLETFRTVAQERLDRLNLGWIQFEQGTGGPNASTVFLREIHTLKGEAGLTGFASVSRLLHRLEDLVGAAIKSGGALDASAGDLVMRGLDLAGTVIKRPPEPESDDINTFLSELPRPEPKPAPGAPAAAPAAPAAAPAAPPSAPHPATVTSGTTAAGAPATEAPRRAPTQESVRLTSEKLDGLRDLVAELLLTRVRLERSAAELRKAKETALDLRSSTRQPGQLANREINQLGEALSGLEVRLRDEAHQVSRLVGGLDASTRDLRMVPLGFLLDRYPIAVRTLSRKLGKQVQLRTEGDATEVDREVLERLAEPLLHLIQNAVDHGIEDVDKRTRAGKPAEATIVLRAWLAGQTLHVEVSDDGGGIDARAVRERAISLKILDALSARQLGDDQIIRTIFSAGFSSRSQVTETSGRGIGLNVVLSAVEGLGGRVDLRTTLGLGTVFHLQVPVTVAISAVVLFRTGASRYAIPTSAVETIVETNADAGVDSVDGRAIKHAGRVIPLLSLENLLGEQAIGANKDGRGGRILIVRSGGDRVALGGSFDHVEREVVLKPAGKFFEQQRLVSAAVHLEDGSLALVLKPTELVFAARGERRPDVAVAGTAAPRTGFGKTVLVVDDSPVVRDLIADALRAHGMRVIEGQDGEEGLSLLATHPSIDLVVTDFEMPRLDGIGLIRAQRARESGRRLPMVVVSMRGSEADKKLALDAGADSYLVKSDFSHAGLWTMIARFLGEMSVRVVIVDDSPLVRGLLREALTEQPDLQVVGEAGDGLAALRLIKQTRPDVVTMDVLMPIMGGPEAIRRVMQECPTPIVVFAAARADHNLAWQALESGAAEVFAKPTGGLDAVTVANLAAALRRAASARVARKAAPNPATAPVPPRPVARGGTAVIGIVGSTGAPRVLQAILSALPPTFPWPIAIVQHTLRGFADSLVKWLAGYTALNIELARHGTELRRGTVVVAPDDNHLEIHAKGRVHLNPGPSVDGHRPSATVLLKSLASAYGMRAAGLVLTGMGRDGAEGAQAIDAAKGLVLVEEPSTAMLPSMPGEALGRCPSAIREEAERLGRLLVELSSRP